MSAEPFDGLALAKQLLRTVRSGALSTLTPEAGPFASLAAVATMPDGRPILLLSRLAAHTRHLDGDDRCSLLLAESGRGDPLAHPRLTLVGHAAPAGEQAEAARRRFLARNPKSKLYADFPDFGFWIVSLTEAHLNGGFARAAEFTGAELLTSLADCNDLVAGEAGAVDHMNADHADAVAAYATGLAGLPPGPWRLTGVDPEGVDLACGDQTGRVLFETRVTTRTGLRKALVDLVAAARQQTPKIV